MMNNRLIVVEFGDLWLFIIFINILELLTTVLDQSPKHLITGPFEFYNRIQLKR